VPDDVAFISTKQVDRAYKMRPIINAAPPVNTDSIQPSHSVMETSKDRGQSKTGSTLDNCILKLALSIVNED